MKFAHDPAQQAAAADLRRVLRDHEDQGRPVPCLDRRAAWLWTSEHRGAQLLAASACLTCPALAACTDYAATHPEPAAVWAGRRPRKEPTPKGTPVTQTPPMEGPEPAVYRALLDELDAYAMRALLRPAADCTPRELFAIAPARLVSSLTALVGHPRAVDLARLSIRRRDLGDGRARCGLDVPVRELVGFDMTPICVGAPTVAARDAFEASKRDVSTCGCSIRVDYDEAGRILLASARPAHTCGRDNFDEATADA